MKRQLERDRRKLEDARWKLAMLGDGFQASRPIEVESSSQVEPQVRGMRCPACDVAFHVLDHVAKPGRREVTALRAVRKKAAPVLRDSRALAELSRRKYLGAVRTFQLIAVGVLVVGCGGGAGGPEAQTATIPAASASAAPAPAGQRYAIRMHRDSHVGERTREEIDGQKQETVTSRLLGQPPSKTDKITHTRLVGTSVVQEVDDKQDTRRSEITVAELWQTLNDGAKTVLAPAGARVTIVRAKKKEDAQVTVNGQPASKEVRDALDDILTLSSGVPTDDDIFGTKEPQAVGAQWLPNVALAEKDLRDKGMVARPGGISGLVKLVGTAKVDNVDCLDLQADIAVTGIESVSDLPQGSVVQSGGVSAHMRGLFPVDGNLGRRVDEMEVVTKMKVRVPSPQGDVQVDVKAVDHRHAVYTPL